ncbi:hypothetical protein ACMFMF_005074 [Clarireedia jacksonii]
MADFDDDDEPAIIKSKSNPKSVQTAVYIDSSDQEEPPASELEDSDEEIDTPIGRDSVTNRQLKALHLKQVSIRKVARIAADIFNTLWSSEQVPQPIMTTRPVTKSLMKVLNDFRILNCRTKAIYKKKKKKKKRPYVEPEGPRAKLSDTFYGNNLYERPTEKFSPEMSRGRAKSRSATSALLPTDTLSEVHPGWLCAATCATTCTTQVQSV